MDLENFKKGLKLIAEIYRDMFATIEEVDAWYEVLKYYDGAVFYSAVIYYCQHYHNRPFPSNIVEIMERILENQNEEETSEY